MSSSKIPPSGSVPSSGNAWDEPSEQTKPQTKTSDPTTDLASSALVSSTTKEPSTFFVFGNQRVKYEELDEAGILDLLNISPSQENKNPSTPKTLSRL